MISIDLARRLRDGGVVWHPRTGDRFTILQPEMSGDVFTISDMMIEAHEYSTGTVLGFNGTTEWALDSVAIGDALWFPREDQLREALKATFVLLERSGDGWAVTTRFRGDERRFEALAADEAYGLALLEQGLASAGPRRSRRSAVSSRRCSASRPSWSPRRAARPPGR